MVEGPDPKTWPDQLDKQYDLAFSFAALWWFDDPWTVVQKHAQWADKAVLTCCLNKNVFIRLRQLSWHKGLFDRLNLDSLNHGELLSTAQRLGLHPIDTGLFDIPPFPDTSLPLAKVARALLGKKPELTAVAKPSETATCSVYDPAALNDAVLALDAVVPLGEKPTAEEADEKRRRS